MAGHKPTTGTRATLSFLECDLEELQVHGFTFFETPYAAGHNDHVKTSEDARKWGAASLAHDPEREKLLIRDQIEMARSNGMKVVLGRNLAHYL